jgi:outer membrane receptor protein involved in Fe transport
MRSSTLALFVLIVVLTCAGVASAQQTTGTITGRAIDAQNLAVPGATVTLTGPQGSKTTVTDSQGRYTFPYVTPGTYTVRAELTGFNTVERKEITVSLGQTVEIPLTLTVGGVSENVQVTASSPIIDRTSTTTGAVISSELLDRVPVGRRVSDTLYLAPGVSSGGTVGQANPSMSGGSGLENQYVIDGVNVTNQGYGALGSYSIVFGSLGNATPYDFVKDVEVKTGGYEAEFGQSTGGVVNVITKSGSNALKGSAFVYGRPSGLESTWTEVQTPNGTVQTTGSRSYDGGVEGGGPIVKDRVFFFGAIDPSRDVRTFQAPQGFPLLSLGGVDRTRDSKTYAAKGTIQLSNGQRIDASFFGDPSKGLNGPQRASSLLNQTTAGFSSLDYGGHNQTVRYDGAVRPNWLLEGYFAHAVNNIAETPSVDAWDVTDRTVTPNVTTGGIGFYEAGNRSNSYQYAVKGTNFVGQHQVRYGYEYDRANWDQLNNYTGPTFTAPNGQQTATGAIMDVISDPTYGQIYRVTRARFTSGPTTTQSYQSFFVQDTWRVGDRLIVNPGLRYEQQTLNGNVLSGFSLKNNWAPRIGATYQPDASGKTKVYGNWGRYYSRMPNDLAARALSSELTVTRGDYFDAGLTQPIPDGTLAGGQTTHLVLSGGTAGDTIDPNSKMSYIDEFVVGMDREVLPHTSVGVNYIHRNTGRVLEDVANCPMAAYFEDATSSICTGVSYILTNPTSTTAINPDVIAADPSFANVAFATPRHVYDAVEFTWNTRFSSNWSALASYRWSRLRGNFEGFYRDDNGQSDPGISSLYDFPQNDPTYTSIGVPNFGFEGDIQFLGDPNGILPLDRPNQFKVYGQYMWHNLNLGVGAFAGSGAPLTPLTTNPAYGNGGEIPTAARGSGIQTVDGFKTRTPFQHQIDFQAGYDFKLGGDRRVTLLADIFNLFDQQIVQNYDTWTSLTFGGGPNPNFGQQTSQILAGPQIQAPRQIRLGARFSF